MNCKLKLHSKGFYQQILGAVTVLKFLQKLALDFPYICLQFFPGNFYRQMYRKFLKKVLGLLAHVTPSNFFSRILKSEVLVYSLYFFQNSRFTEIIRHLTNAVISHGFAYSSRWRRNRDKVYSPCFTPPCELAIETNLYLAINILPY